MSYIKFSSIFDSANYKKRIAVQCLVTGKTTEPYLIPKTILLKCDYQQQCGNCAVPGSKIEVSAENDNVIYFIDTKQTSFNTIVKNLVKRNCKSLTHEVLEVQNVERIFISQPTGRYREKHTTTHAAYFVGYGIDANYNYDFSGIPTIDPSTQIITVVFDKAKKLKTDIESFKLTPKIHEQLKQFQIKDATPEKIFDVLGKLYETYAHNFTKIYGRQDLHMAIDLAIHTVIEFTFANEHVKKGWGDILIVGDPRTGKGYVAKGLAEYYNVGDLVAGDNCSYAGLVGGVDIYNGHRIISWGRIPLNDLGMVIIDEAGELKEDWGRLDIIRSEGVASVEKIVKASANARTRLINLANPDRGIAQYSYGIDSAKDIMPAAENIARCDYIVVVASTEVDIKMIHMERKPLEPLFDRESEQNLVLWTWSRQKEEIKFTEKAVKAIYTQAVNIASQYSSDIPLIQGADVRIKIARLAVSFAARFYSCDETGTNLIVDEAHVLCAVIFLNSIYKKPACGYYTKSQLSKSLQTTYNEDDIMAIEKYLGSFVKDKEELCKCLLNNNVLTTRDIAEHLNFTHEIAQEIMSKLLKHSMIVKKFQNTYVKTKQFTDWLKKQVLKANNMEVN